MFVKFAYSVYYLFANDIVLLLWPNVDLVDLELVGLIVPTRFSFIGTS